MQEVVPVALRRAYVSRAMFASRSMNGGESSSIESDATIVFAARSSSMTRSRASRAKLYGLLPPVPPVVGGGGYNACGEARSASEQWGSKLE